MRTTIEQVGTPHQGRTRSRLLALGIVAMAASALGSVLAASPAESESPSTDDRCRIQIVDGHWYGSGCDDGVARSTP